MHAHHLSVEITHELKPSHGLKAMHATICYKNHELYIYVCDHNHLQIHAQIVNAKILLAI